jgi:hypothetical protein
MSEKFGDRPRSTCEIPLVHSRRGRLFSDVTKREASKRKGKRYDSIPVPGGPPRTGRRVGQKARSCTVATSSGSPDWVRAHKTRRVYRAQPWHVRCTSHTGSFCTRRESVAPPALSLSEELHVRFRTGVGPRNASPESVARDRQGAHGDPGPRRAHVRWAAARSADADLPRRRLWKDGGRARVPRTRRDPVPPEPAMNRHDGHGRRRSCHASPAAVGPSRARAGRPESKRSPQVPR